MWSRPCALRGRAGETPERGASAYEALAAVFILGEHWGGRAERVILHE